MSKISDERREAARRLRKTRVERYNSILNGIHLGEIVGVGAQIVSPHEDQVRAAADRLADLIDQPEITEDTSDGYHTFGQLYYQRMVLFATLVQEHKDCAWKTWNHEDGKPCFGGGWFLVTIDTPKGAYGYHFEKKYWNLFDCPELPRAKHWGGYTEKDAKRLFSLNGYKVNDE